MRHRSLWRRIPPISNAHPYFIKFNEETGQPYVSVPLLARYVREHLCYLLVRDNSKQGLLKYVYEAGCYRLYSSDMFHGVIKQYIADYDEELVKMSKANEVLQAFFVLW